MIYTEGAMKMRYGALEAGGTKMVMAIMDEAGETEQKKTVNMGGVIR